MAVTVHPTALVDPGATLGADVQIGPFCVVGPEVVLGDRVVLQSHVVVEGRTSIGADTRAHPFCTLGGPPQVAGVRHSDTRLEIGERNVLREYTNFHVGTPAHRGLTKVGDDGLFMVGSHVAHDCIVGDNVIFANHATLAGHVTVGDFATLGGLCAVHQHSRIGRYAFIGGMATVTKDVIPYGTVWGNHAHLEGLNLVGLKRRGFSRESVNHLRAAYRLLFAEEGTFQERIADTAEAYASSPEVMEIINFIRADANRPLCLPKD